MAKRKVACWMCGQVGKLTEEHAVPDWIREIFAADGNDITLSKDRAGPKASSTTWTNQSGEVTVRSVCERCNQQWMSQLENRCQPFLGPLICGHAPKLDPAAQRDLATWAVKTAWVFQSMDPTTSTCTAEQRLALAQSLTIPANVVVTAAAFYESGEQVLCTNWYVAGSTSPEGDLDSSTTTLLVGRIIFQVIQRPIGVVTAQAGATLNPNLPRHFVLTEDRSGLIAWPPGQPLREDELDGFVRPADFAARPWPSLRQLPGSASASQAPVIGGADG